MIVKEDKIVLVTGATGHQGGAVARKLVSEGWPVRAFVRDPNKDSARRLASLGIELFKGDLDDRSSVERALTGVYGVFSVQIFWEKGVEGEIRQGTLLADAAMEAGVKHFIYSSVGGADRDTGIPHFDSKWTIEEHIRGIGIPATIFRPVFFMYNFFSPEISEGIRKGTLSMAVRSGRVLQMLAVEDMAAFVNLALENPAHYIGKAFELAGDELTMPKAAEVIGNVIGRTVRYMEKPIEEVRKGSEDLAKMFEWFNEHGYRANISALRALYPQLTNFEAWLRRTGWRKAA